MGTVHDRSQVIEKGYRVLRRVNFPAVRDRKSDQHVRAFAHYRAHMRCVPFLSDTVCAIGIASRLVHKRTLLTRTHAQDNIPRLA